MSEVWSAATRINAFTARASTQPFVPWRAGPANDDVVPAPEPEEAVIDPARIEADAFAQGYEMGRRAVEMEMAGERAALDRLVATLGVLQPEEPQALGALLAETVDRLVRQIVGEVSFDGTLLHDRAMAAAALIADETAPSRMRLHPDDHARLGNAPVPVEMVADPALAPGTVLLESAEGWIEDGPDVGLEKLRAVLDRLGAPR